MPVWYEQPNVAHRLGHPFVHPGGPSVVAEPAAARRQSVQEFQEQATAAWSGLVNNMQQGLQAVAQLDEQPASPQPTAALQQQQQQQQQQSTHGPNQQPSPGAQVPELDLSGLQVPLLPRRRLTGPVLLVPQPDPVPPGIDPEQATAAAVAAAVAAQPAGQPRMTALVVPAGCLQLHSWQESAAAEEPPGVVVGCADAVVPPAAATGSGLTRAVQGDDVMDDVMEPGSEVVVTFAIMDTSRRHNVLQQEIQALGSNTLAEVRDAISCPTDQLAAGLGAANGAAYFYISGSFYDDTRSAAVAECSPTVEQWARRLGMVGPKHFLQHHNLPNDGEEVQPLQQQEGSQDTTPAAADAQHMPAMLVQPEQSTTSLQQPQHQQGVQAQEQRKEQPPRDMQHVQLRALLLQASNRPMALYSHQGLCEHAVVVTDVRLLHAADPSRRSAYPRTVFKAALAKRLGCGVCRRLGATALMLDHPETPEAVIVLCQLCCGLFSMDGHPQAKLIMLEPF